MRSTGGAERGWSAGGARAEGERRASGARAGRSWVFGGERKQLYG
ncbi:Hypothetical protein CAP_6490 [Chondromyces apiculatus DSM 436]|uniref:Uncharacterized protein n=1 Tax=Chondromyces apiculatus DSM 436 TaxID=1192034 RepID=A0A017T1N0_9BACT|nr:Hypothetical protein CAP_6490 [Chondromyces apiculatus DSM 436]